MPFNLESLTNFTFPESRQTYTQRDTILYALGIGLGSDPVDPDQLRFVYEQGLEAFPSMAVVLAHPGFWAAESALGIDWVRMLQGEQGLTLYRAIPVEGDVIGRSRIRDVIDRGPEKGAILYYERDVVDAATDELIATVRQTLMCRGNGGFSPERRAPRAVHPIPARAPDRVVTVRTLPQAALIYRLSGDVNPLHADPEVARKAGFERPILHGLATYGVIVRALLECGCNWQTERLRELDLRFSSPVYPGETIRCDFWNSGDVISVRATVVERDRLVVDNGRARVVAGTADMIAVERHRTAAVG